MSQLREGDLFLYQTNDGGEISVTNGEPVMDGGFQSAIELSLAGHDNTPHWTDEYLKPFERLKSEFLPFIIGAPKTAANILRAEELAKKDLQWLLDTKAADKINVDIISINVSRVFVSIEILADGNTIAFNEFEKNWGFEKDSPANLRI